MAQKMNYWELKELAKRADRARGEERRQLVDKLIRELPKLDPFEGHSDYSKPTDQLIENEGLSFRTREL